MLQNKRQTVTGLRSTSVRPFCNEDSVRHKKILWRGYSPLNSRETRVQNVSLTYPSYDLTLLKRENLQQTLKRNQIHHKSISFLRRCSSTLIDSERSKTLQSFLNRLESPLNESKTIPEPESSDHLHYNDYLEKTAKFKEEFKYVAPGRFLLDFYHKRDELVSELLETGNDDLAFMVIKTTKNPFVCYDDVLLPRLIKLIDSHGSVFDLSDFFELHFDKKEVYSTLDNITELKNTSEDLRKLLDITSLFIETKTASVDEQGNLLESVADMSIVFYSKFKGLQKLATYIFAQTLNQIKDVNADFKEMLIREFLLNSKIPYENFCTELYTHFNILQLPKIQDIVCSMPYDKKLLLMKKYTDSNSDYALILKTWFTLFQIGSQDLVGKYFLFSREIALLKDKIFTQQLDLPTLLKELDESDKSFPDLMSILIYGFGKYQNFEAISNLCIFKENKGFKLSKEDTIELLISSVYLENYERANALIAREKTPLNLLTERTYAPIIKLSKVMNNNSYVNTIFEHLKSKDDDQISQDLYKTILEFRSEFGDSKGSNEVWDLLLNSGYQPDSELLTNVIEGFIGKKMIKEASEWLAKFYQYNVPMSTRSYELQLQTWSSENNIALIFKLLDELASTSHQLTIKSFEPLLHNISLHGDFNVVCTITDYYMPKFGIETSIDDYKFMIRALYHSSRYNDAMNLFDSLQNNGIVTYDTVYYTLLSASNLKDEGKRKFQKYWQMCSTDPRIIELMDAKLYSVFIQRAVLIHGTNCDVEQKISEYNKIHPVDVHFFNRLINVSTTRRKMNEAIYFLNLMNSYNIELNLETIDLLCGFPYVPPENLPCDSYREMIMKLCVSLKDTMDSSPSNYIQFPLIQFHIRGLLHNGATKEALNYFSFYENSPKEDYAKNCTYQSTKLALLGASKNWDDFKTALDTYIDLVKDQLAQHISARDHSRYSNLLNKENQTEKQYPISKTKLQLPTEIRCALFPIWNYILEFHQVANLEGNIIQFIDDLRSCGFDISDTMLNETAVMLSKKNFEEAILFIDKELISGPISFSKLREAGEAYLTQSTERKRFKLYLDAYRKILRNLRHIITLSKSSSERQAFYKALQYSEQDSIMKYLNPAYNTIHRITLKPDFSIVNRFRLSLFLTLSKFNSVAFYRVNGYLKRKNLYFLKVFSFVKHALGLHKSSHKPKDN